MFQLILVWDTISHQCEYPSFPTYINILLQEWGYSISSVT